MEFTKKQMGIFITICLLLGFVVGISVHDIIVVDRLYVPTFGIAYVVTNVETGKAYQLGGQESFRIEDSTIKFIPAYRSAPYNEEDIVSWNGNWTLRTGFIGE